MSGDLIVLPFISIIVPTFNRPRQLETCCHSLAAIQYPRDRWEVIVVDDGSSTPLDAVVEPFRNKFDLTLIRQTNAGPAAARNSGAAHARGDYLAFTDDDCAPSPDWLAALAEAFERDPEAAIGGKTINALAGNPYSTASQLLIDYLYEYYDEGNRKQQFFASNNLAFPTKVFRSIGGFDTRFPRAAAEDREICNRWIAQGKLLVYVCKAVVRHAHALTLRGFCRQHFNYGRGAFYFHHWKADGNGCPLERDSWSFYTRLLTYPLGRTRFPESLKLVALTFISQVTNAAGFFYECAQRPAVNQAGTAQSKG